MSRRQEPASQAGSPPAWQGEHSHALESPAAARTQTAAKKAQNSKQGIRDFRIVRAEKLERYKALFDLAAQYAFMAAQAYDYETGLLHTQQGKEFINRIVRARALGIVQNGEPQFADGNTGDPGLSSAMAEMFSDWGVLKGRLGFNNPDAFGTTVSLRTENYRILPGTDGNANWKDILNRARKANILDDPDVRRYSLQLDPGNGQAVPGLVLEFSTTIARGMNLFGQTLTTVIVWRLVPKVPVTSTGSGPWAPPAPIWCWWRDGFACAARQTPSPG